MLSHHCQRCSHVTPSVDHASIARWTASLVYSAMVIKVMIHAGPPRLPTAMDAGCRDQPSGDQRSCASDVALGHTEGNGKPRESNGCGHPSTWNGFLPPAINATASDKPSFQRITC